MSETMLLYTIIYYYIVALYLVDLYQSIIICKQIYKETHKFYLKKQKIPESKQNINNKMKIQVVWSE